MAIANIKTGRHIRMDSERGMKAFSALGALTAMAEAGGYDPKEVQRLHDTIAPVLHRGANYSYSRSRTMMKRARTFPRNPTSGRFVTRTEPETLPF